MYNSNNPFYIEMTADGGSYKQLRLEDNTPDKDQLHLLRVFDLPADEFVTPEEVTFPLANPLWEPDSAPITITTNVTDLPTKIDNIIIDIDLVYPILALAISVTLISPSGTSVEAYPRPPVGDWLGETASHAISTKTTHPGENWEGEWKIVLAFAVPLGSHLNITKADYRTVCPTLELTTEEARTIYTLPNADSSGSSMYSVDAVNKKVVFSETSLLWLNGVHHSRGYDIELPAINNTDTIILLRKTDVAGLTKEWLITEAMGSSDMRKSLSQILFLNSEYSKRAEFPKLNPFTDGTRNGYGPLDKDGNSDHVILQKFFPASIGILQYISFYPSWNDVYSENQVCSVDASDIDGLLDFCHLPASLNTGYTLIKDYIITWDPLEESGPLAELHMYLEHPDVRELKITIEDINSTYTLKDYGVSNESGGIVNLDTVFGARSHTFGGGYPYIDALDYPVTRLSERIKLRIYNNGGQDGYLIRSEFRCYTGYGVSSPVTWQGQITGERLEEFGDAIDVIPRAGYQFEFRTVVGGYTNKWLPSIPFGYSALTRYGGELVKWRQASPDDNIIAGWHTVGLKLGHLSNIQAKRRIYD